MVVVVVVAPTSCKGGVEVGYQPLRAQPLACLAILVTMVHELSQLIKTPCGPLESSWGGEWYMKRGGAVQRAKGKKEAMGIGPAAFFLLSPPPLSPPSPPPLFLLLLYLQPRQLCAHKMVVVIQV